MCVGVLFGRRPALSWSRHVGGHGMIWKVNLWEGEAEARLEDSVNTRESFQAAEPIHAGFQREGLVGQVRGLDIL